MRFIVQNNSLNDLFKIQLIKHVWIDQPFIEKIRFFFLLIRVWILNFVYFMHCLYQLN